MRHSLADLLKQRVYALCLGHEDLNDHHVLRRDTLLQAAERNEETVGREGMTEREVKLLLNANA